MVAVSLNYRLGPFGFLCASDGVRESGHTGNYGIYDQLAALQWVHDNISAFGGDPDNVTLMGQSAGCMSAQMLCISPKAEGLFRRAVLCSGSGRSEFFDGRVTMEENLSFGDAVMEALGCKTMEDMRCVSAWRILKTFGELLMKANRGLSVTSPVIDGDLIPCPVSTALVTKLLHNIPYILCSTGQDLWQPELYHAILQWEDEAEAQFIEEMDQWAAKDLHVPFVFTEFGADTLDTLHKLPSVMWSQEYQSEYMDMNFSVFDRYPFVQGELAWNFADFQTGQGVFRVNGNKRACSHGIANPRTPPTP